MKAMGVLDDLPPSAAPTILFEAMRAGRRSVFTFAFIAARKNAG
jgi:hypothetical protein